MSCRNVVAVVGFACMIGACARSTSGPAPALNASAPLDAPANAVWVEHHRRRLAQFEQDSRATIWPVQQELADRLSAAWPPPDAPVRWGGYEYFAKDEAGLRYPIIARKTPTNGQETVLDLNREFPTTGVDIGAVRIAPDNSAIAVTLDFSGSGSYALFTRQLPAGELTGPLSESVHEVEWGSGGELYFTAMEALQAKKLFRRTAQGEVKPLPLPVPADGHLALRAGGIDRSVTVRVIAPAGGKVWVLRSAPKTVKAELLTAPRLKRNEKVIDGCPISSGRLLIIRSDTEESINWLPGGRRAKLERLATLHVGDGIETVRCFSAHALLAGRRSFQPALWSFAAEGEHATLTPIAIPRGLTALTLGAPTSTDEPNVRLQLSSLINPPLLYELDLRRGALEATAQMRVRDFDPNRYSLAVLEARSADGTAIPVTAAYRPDRADPHRKPVVLAAYGAYGVSARTDFSSLYLPLLDRGFMVAVAHIRGGGDGGQAWHAASRGGTKSVGVSDFIAAAEALRKLGWGADKGIAALGRSAGAIVAADAAIIRPDLFGAVVLDSPFLDIVGALSDSGSPLALRDRLEWGDPNDAATREAMKRFAPFDLALPPNVPPTLAVMGRHDATVSPLEGARWIERLEKNGSADNLVVMSDGGHGGGATRSEQHKIEALTVAFIVSRLSEQTQQP